MGLTRRACRLLFSGCLWLTAVCCCRLPLSGTGEEITVLSYNVQNLCDDVDNGLEYHEFDPGGGEWGTRLFHRRLLALARTLRAHPRGGADIILLQEVENGNVLGELRDHYLHGGGYSWSAVTAVPGSPINLACLSRLPLEEVRVHALSVEGQPAGRPVMELRVDCGGRTLILLHCHWKSKSGGARETEVLRRHAARFVAARLGELRRRRPAAELAVAGDLNESADEWLRVGGAYPTALMPAGAGGFAATGGEHRTAADVLTVTGDAQRWRASGRETAAALLYSPWLAGEMDAAGSYYYDGRWESIDHFLLDPSLGDRRGLRYRSCTAVIDSRLLGERGTPLRWITRTERGCSDHLPLLLRLKAAGK